MCYFDHLYIELYTTKKYKKKYYETMRLDDSNKISLDNIYFYKLAAIYKINLNDE